MKKLIYLSLMLILSTSLSASENLEKASRKISIEEIETLKISKVESTTVVSGIPVVDVLGNALEAAIEIANTVIQTVGKTRKTVQGLIEEGTSAVEDITEEWYSSLEVVNDFVSDYKGIERIVNETMDVITDGYKFINDVQYFENLPTKIKETSLEHVTNLLENNQSYIDDMDSVLSSGKLTDAERLNIIDLIGNKVEKVKKDVKSLAGNMKSTDNIRQADKEGKKVFKNFFGE